MEKRDILSSLRQQDGQTQGEHRSSSESRRCGNVVEEDSLLVTGQYQDLVQTSYSIDGNA